MKNTALRKKQFPKPCTESSMHAGAVMAMIYIPCELKQKFEDTHKLKNYCAVALKSHNYSLTAKRYAQLCCTTNRIFMNRGKKHESFSYTISCTIMTKI